MRQLIVNADDFGFTPGVNAGIVRAFSAGILTSTTIMANGPAFEDAVQLSLTNPSLPVGCHLTLVGGIPSAPPHEVPTLIDAAGMPGSGEQIEFVFVDDHSTDGTLPILEHLAENDPRIIVIHLKRNYGQTAALAEGAIIIAMDGDLQHDPADIPAMLRVFEDTGCDIVSGWRNHRADNLLLRRLPSRMANWLMSRLSGVNIHDFGTTFKVYRRETIKQIRLYGEMHRFIPALASWNGATVVEVPIRNIERPGGRSHYGISRTLRVLFDLLTIRFLLKYVTRPLHFLGPPGLLSILLGIAIFCWLIIEKMIYGTDLFEQHGPLMLLGAVLFLAGVQLISSGILAELSSRTYFESQGNRSTLSNA